MPPSKTKRPKQTGATVDDLAKQIHELKSLVAALAPKAVRVGGESLTAVIDRHKLQNEISPKYVYQLQITARMFSQFIGHDGTTDDLAESTVNKWLLHLTETRRSRCYVLQQRRNILVLWNAARKHDRAIPRPENVRRVKGARPEPKSWSIDDVRRMVELAKRLPRRFYRSTFKPVPKRAFWPAWILVAWDTALRRGDLVTLQWSEFNGRVIHKVQHKTGNTIACPLNEATVAALEELRAVLGDGDFIFGWRVGAREQTLLNEGLSHYHEERRHQRKGNAVVISTRCNAPEGTSRKKKNRKPPPDVVPLSQIACKQRLGGLQKHYYRKAP